MTRVVRDGGEIAATLTVSDPAPAYAFWKSELPRAGYSVSSAEFVGSAGEIRFAGHGCGGNSQIAINSTAVAVQCESS